MKIEASVKPKGSRFDVRIRVASSKPKIARSARKIVLVDSKGELGRAVIQGKDRPVAYELKVWANVPKTERDLILRNISNRKIKEIIPVLL